MCEELTKARSVHARERAAQREMKLPRGRTIRQWFSYAFVVTSLAGCATTCGKVPHVPRLSIEEAVATANAAAIKAGLDLTRFSSPEAHFEYVESDCRWFVHYEGKDSVVGNHFGVFVHDATRRTDVGFGM